MGRCLLLHLTLLHFSISLLIPGLLWESFSGTMACTLSSSSTTCLSRLWLTGRCLSFSGVLLVVRLTPEMCSIYTPVSWREQPRCLTPWVVAPSLPFQSLRPRLVMCLLTFPQM